jgi:hypothetical protein
MTARFLDQRVTIDRRFSHSCFSFQIGINPGMYAAYKGHHYAGPGNHFCKLPAIDFYECPL